jgi:hypothetical protein
MEMLPQAVFFRSGAKSGGKKEKINILEKKENKMKKILSLITLILSLSSVNFLNAQNPCPSFNDCIVKQATEHYCFSTPNSPSCIFEYKVCYGSINGVPSIFIEYFIIDQNCPCEDMMRHYMLKDIFENSDILDFFDITQPSHEYIYDLYVANCAQKVFHQGSYGTNGQFTYPGWKIINCGDQGCCKHTYKVVYRYNCNSNPQCLKLDWYNKDSTSSFSENCIQPCFPNCYNWTGYSGPPMDMVKNNVSYDMMIDLNNKEKFDLQEQIKILNLENQNYQIKIYNLNGNLMFEGNIDKNTDIKDLIRNNKMGSKVYVYEVINKNETIIKGKVLINN